MLNSPQRQSSIGVIIEIIYAGQKTLRQFWPLLILAFVKIKNVNLGILITAIILLVALIVIYGFLYYRNFLFCVEDDGSFILKRGVFSKKKVSILPEKIQQVNINQSFIQRILNVYEVEIETAGGIEKEVKINAVSHNVAMEIKTILLEKKVESTAETEQASFIKVSVQQLLIYALSSGFFKSLWIVIIFLLALYTNAKNIIDKDDQLIDFLINKGKNHILISAVIIPFIAVFIFNFLRVLIVYFDYTIAIANKAYSFSYGLFNRKDTVTTKSKIQLVIISQNIIQKKINLCKMYIRQFSSNYLKDTKATIHVPAMTSQNGQFLLQDFFNHGLNIDAILNASKYRFSSNIIKYVIVPTLVFIFINQLVYPINYFAALIIIYIISVTAILLFDYKNYKLGIGENIIVKYAGVFNETRTFIQPKAIQAISVKQYFWHRQAGVLHIYLHTAGGNLIFKFVKQNEILPYLNYWLYLVEKE